MRLSTDTNTHFLFVCSGRFVHYQKIETIKKNERRE